MSADEFEFGALDCDEVAWTEDWTEPSPQALACIRGSEPAQWYRLRSGLLCNEVPLRPNLGLKKAEALEEKLGLVRAPTATTAARRSIIANVLYAHAQSPAIWVFYSRDRNYYASQTRRYFPAHYTYATMMGAVQSLEEHGLIEHRKTVPSPVASHRSRLSAGPLLLAQLKNYHPEFLSSPREVIILRDASRLLVDYAESDRVHDMRRDVCEHNELLSGADITLDRSTAYYDEFGFLRIEDRWLDPKRQSYHRVFNGSWTRGGRWFGPFWQGLPKQDREHLLINGEPVVECDYRACHLRLLCARAGLELPFHEAEFDPYQVKGFDRKRIKLAFNVMLNASHEKKAYRAIANELAADGISDPCRRASMLMRAVRDQFPDFEKSWCSGEGVRLQNIDADICRRVQRRLRRQNIQILSIHDSFITPKSTDEVLANVMEEEMTLACRKLANRQ